MFLVRQNFTAGEISPRMGARFDMKKYHNACKTLTNAYSLPHGPVMSRPGFEYIAETKDSSKASRLVPFEFSEEQAYILEFGNLYIRFYKDGGQIVMSSADSWATTTDYYVDDWVDESGTLYVCEEDHNSGTFATDLAAGKWTAQTEYEITTTYTEAELDDLKFCQSADKLYIVHPDHHPAVLTRTSHTAWTLEDITFLEYPTVFNYNDYTITPSGTTGSITLTASSSMFESDHVGSRFKLHDGLVVITAYTSGTVVTGTVTAQKDKAEEFSSTTDYDVGDWVTYSGTIYQCVVTHDAGAWNGSNFLADATLSATDATDYWEEGEWSDHRGYPSCVNFFEQRLCFAASSYAPQTIWMSKSADYYNFGISTPLQDDDACTYTISSDQVNVIKWLSPAGVLGIGTTGGEWILSGGQNDVVTPTSVKVVRQSTHGSIGLQPVMVGSVHLFVQKNSKTVREFRYSFEMDSFESIDLSIISEHLTRTYTISDWAYQQAPNSIIWAVRSDGTLLGLTYLRQHEVVGWHKHTTSGSFESVACIPGDTEDELWAIVNRTIDGSTVRYVERLAEEFNPSSTDPTDGFYVDCGATYSGAATTSISGLDHLEGETVTILGDGAVQPQKTVSSGAITLQNSVSKAHIGIGYNVDFEPMPLDLISDDATTMGREKSVVAARVNFVDSSGLQAGFSFDSMQTFTFRTAAHNLGEYVPLFTGVKRKVLPSSYDSDATVCFRQSQPLPMTVRGVTYEVEVND